MAIYVVFWFTSLLSGMAIRSRIATNIFLLVVFCFIGLRLDTGFDWPVYKSIYQDFQLDFSVQKVAIYSQIFGQEPGFLLLLGLFAKYLPSYEFFQAFVTIIFLMSTVHLSRTLGVRKVALVIAIALTFLLWTLGFSTIRQTMAISLFNYGLACFFLNRRIFGLLFFFGSTLFQVSSVVYIAAFFATRFLWRSRRPPSLNSFLIGVFVASIVAPTGIALVSAVSGLAASKLDLYLQLSSGHTFVTQDFVYMTFFVASALVVSRGMTRTAFDLPFENDIRRLIMALAAIGAASTFIPVLRDRVAYELFALVSVYLMTRGVRHRWPFVGFFVCFGLAITTASTFPFPQRLAFSPYQNAVVSYVLGKQSTGADRNGEFFKITSETGPQ